VLTTVRAFSSWQSADMLLLDDAGRAETDLIQIRNVEGLGPVKAAVNTAPFGSVDGDSYVGSSVGSRNIVLTIRPNPDWHTWSMERLRRLLYIYFMPKSLTRLVFETDEIPPVEISGIVETNEPVLFSKDGEIQVSIICPYPYFTAVNPTILTGISSRDNSSPLRINYAGSIETGINVEVSRSSGASPASIAVQVGDPSVAYFRVAASVDATKYFAVNTVPGQKYTQNVAFGTGLITNLLSKIQEGSKWPTLVPDQNDFSVITDVGVQDWKLTYFERFGGL
jgi:Phage tail protein